MTHAIGVLLFPDFQLLDATGPIAAFEMPMRGMDPPPYSLRLLSRDGGPVRSSSGVTLLTEALAAAGRLDTLLVAGGNGSRAAMADEALLRAIRAQAASGRRLASVCSGAGLLAAAGVLDGRRCTTHWRIAPALARIFPAVTVEPDRIYVRDGQLWTSAGISAGIDLALAIIAEDLGEAVARRAAQELVVYRRRPGGQSQFSALLALERPEGRFGPLLAWAREHLAEPLDVEQLAARACLSPRQFARAFTAEVGVTPAKAVERLRLEAARAAVEGGAAPIEQVARETGFGDAERMRRAFLRAYGQPPQALRRVHAA